MSEKTGKFVKVFGSGPIGVFVSLILFFVAYWINRQINIPPITGNRFILNSVFLISCLVTIGMIIWCLKSLPVGERGKKLCTYGAFKYFRHPLYAAFLSVFNFGLSFYLNSYVFVLWAIILHPVWHFIVRYEEKLMVNIFKEDYTEYQKKTGRFFPRLIR